MDTCRFICLHEGKVIILDFDPSLNHTDMVIIASFMDNDMAGAAHTQAQSHLYRLVRAGLPMAMIDDTVYTHADVYRWINNNREHQPSGLDPLPMHHKRIVDYSE